MFVYSNHCRSFLTACTSAEQGNIRLANGSTPYEGRVELCYNNLWGTVCDDKWGNVDAGIAYRQLGFSPWGTNTMKIIAVLLTSLMLYLSLIHI